MSLPFWQQKNPPQAYLAAFQQFAGIPVTGVWDQASHEAIYRFVNRFNSEVDPGTAWGAEPEQTVKYIVGLVDEADDEESFAAVRGFLGAIGFPIMSFGDAQAWTENLSGEEAEAITNALKMVAESVGQAESKPLAVATPAQNEVVDTNGGTVVANGETPAANGGTPATNGGATPGNGTAIQPSAAAGMSKGKKIAIGVGVAAGVLLLGWLAWKALSKKPQGGEPPMGDCGCGE